MNRVEITRNPSQEGYYGTYNKCDVMLETMPLGGGTSTAEAINMGVPVIACKYPMRSARLSYTMMENVGLGHLCAGSVEAYPGKVKEVSQNVELLRELRQNLRGRLKDTPLFNTGILRRNFENALRDAHLKHCAEHKKPFGSDKYDGEDGRLLRDCVRAADIVSRELTRKQDADSARLEALLSEYRTINALLLKRLFDIYGDSGGERMLAEKAVELLELLGATRDAVIMGSVIKSIRTILIKFA